MYSARLFVSLPQNKKYTSYDRNTTECRDTAQFRCFGRGRGYAERVAKYLRKLVAEKEADPTLMSEDEFFAHIDKAEQEIAEGKGKSFTNSDDMNAWLNSL